jgi:hypothetical protein
VDTGKRGGASAIIHLRKRADRFLQSELCGQKGCGAARLRLIGTDASVEFDFYTGDGARGPLRYAANGDAPVVSGAHSHFGGDEALALDFMGLMNGQKAGFRPGSPVNSAAVCLAGARSAQSGRPRTGFAVKGTETAFRAASLDLP